MRERPGSEPDHEQPHQFAALLNHLFATRLTPEGRPYTLTEVSKGTGLSVPYLSILRKGTIGAVPFQRVAVLARFFQVSLDYFSQEGSPTESLDEQVRGAGPAAGPGSPPGREAGGGGRWCADRTCRARAQALPVPPDEPRRGPSEEPDARATL